MGHIVVRVRLFGAIHVDRRRKVRRDLKEFSSGVDAFFIEYPVEGFSARTVVKSAVRAPLFTAGMGMYLFLTVPLQMALMREIGSVEVMAARDLSEERSVPVHAIDDHPLSVMSETSARWVVLNLAVLLLTVQFGPLVSLGGTAGIIAAYSGVFWTKSTVGRRTATALATAASASLFACLLIVPAARAVMLIVMIVLLVTVMGTLRGRNRIMMERIADIAEAEGYQSVCLTTGKRHLPGLVSAAEGTDVAVVKRYVPSWLRPGRVEEGPGSRASNRGGDPATAGDVVGQRTVAALVDLVFSAVFGGLITLILWFSVWTSFSESIATTILWLSFFIVPLTPLPYYALWEASASRTPGKRIMRLTVVDETGDPITTRQALVRNAVRPVDFLVFYFVGGLVMLASSTTRTVGDQIAGTFVVSRSRE